MDTIELIKLILAGGVASATITVLGRLIPKKVKKTVEIISKTHESPTATHFPQTNYVATVGLFILVFALILAVGIAINMLTLATVSLQKFEFETSSFFIFAFLISALCGVGMFLLIMSTNRYSSGTIAIVIGGIIGLCLCVWWFHCKAIANKHPAESPQIKESIPQVPVQEPTPAPTTTVTNSPLKITPLGVTPTSAAVDELYLEATKLLEGIGVPKDLVESQRLMRAAADSGHAEANFKLYLFASGAFPFAKLDPVEAKARLVRAAESDSRDAQHELAGKYLSDPAFDRDPQLAYYWCERAAKAGHSGAQFDTGMLLLTGTGTPKNEERALEWILRSAQSKHPKSFLQLGGMYLEGFGVKKNAIEAARWLRMAVSEYHDAAAMTLLAVAIADGKITSIRDREVVELLESAMKLNYPPSFFEAAYFTRMGSNGFPADTAKAVALWKQSQSADIRSPNHEKVFTLSKAEADLGGVEAMKFVADCLLNATGATKDDAQAFKYLQFAEKRGDADATFRLAVCYNQGIGVAKNAAKGEELLRLAATRGDLRAKRITEKKTDAKPLPKQSHYEPGVHNPLIQESNGFKVTPN